MEDKFKSVINKYEYLNNTYPNIKSTKILSYTPDQVTLKTMFSKINLVKLEE